MRKIGLALLLLLVACAAYLLAWPVPIAPVAWTPSPAPELTGPWAQNDRLAGVQLLAGGQGRGPEALALDQQGRVYTGYVDGRVMRFEGDGTRGVELANTGGRPLGLKFAPDGRLIVADAAKGLLHVAEGGVIKPLATAAEERALGFTDDLDITRDGVVYFSDASWKFGHDQVMADFMEHGANGRLLRHSLKTGKTEVLARDLHFPNGVALGPGEQFLLLNETAEYRIWRYWLKGKKAGTLEPFIENLPGFPDNITFDAARNRFWLALYAPRNAQLDAMLPNPFARKVAFRLPDALQPAPVRYGFVVALAPDGEVIETLQDPSGATYAPITSAVAHGRWLYLGSLTAPSFARLALEPGREPKKKPARSPGRP
jgi:sugar lactone lactonase YvrE